MSGLFCMADLTEVGGKKLYLTKLKILKLEV